jgi:hypothetical protein
MIPVFGTNEPLQIEVTSTIMERSQRFKNLILERLSRLIVNRPDHEAIAAIRIATHRVAERQPTIPSAAKLDVGDEQRPVQYEIDESKKTGSGALR